jgi:hypothetical protein
MQKAEPNPCPPGNSISAVARFPLARTSGGTSPHERADSRLSQHAANPIISRSRVDPAESLVSQRTIFDIGFIEPFHIPVFQFFQYKDCQ